MTKRCERLKAIDKVKDTGPAFVSLSLLRIFTFDPRGRREALTDQVSGHAELLELRYLQQANPRGQEVEGALARNFGWKTGYVGKVYGVALSRIPGMVQAFAELKRGQLTVVYNHNDRPVRAHWRGFALRRRSLRPHTGGADGRRRPEPRRLGRRGDLGGIRRS